MNWRIKHPKRKSLRQLIHRVFMNLKMYHADGTYSLNLLHFYMIGSKGYSN